MSFDESLDRLFQESAAFEKPQPLINKDLLLAKEQQTQEKKSHFKKSDPEKDLRTIFVGNVSVKAIQDKKARREFESFFTSFGPIESYRFRSIPIGKSPSRKVAFITKQVREGEDTCNAYVVFQQQESVKTALESNGSLLFEHHLRIDKVISSQEAASQERGSKKSIFVGNLSPDVKEEEMWNLFGNCGSIESVRIVRDKSTNCSKGICFVNFKERASVILALKLDGTSFKGKEIRVFHYQKNAKEKNNQTKVKKEANPLPPRKPRHRKSKSVEKSKKNALTK